jgi:glutamate formiminotransferase/formiminotetrahydrofolate cyclodeaminase
MSEPLIECVPNISEGRNSTLIQGVTSVLPSLKGIRLLDVDPGESTNRTVITFIGSP